MLPLIHCWFRERAMNWHCPVRCLVRVIEESSTQVSNGDLDIKSMEALQDAVKTLMST